MKLIKSKNHEINYLSKIIEIKNFLPHPNPEVEKLKCATVDGFNVLVGIDSKPGLYVYFPTSSKINHKFLSFACLYKDNSLNMDQTKNGMFESNGRVRAIKLKGCVSEGFLIEAYILSNYINYLFNTQEKYDFQCGSEFDTITDNGKEEWLSCKYVVETKSTNTNSTTKRQKNIKKYPRLREDQFKFHYDTVRIEKLPGIIAPNDIIHISSKWHGTSGITARILCKTKETWIQKLLTKWFNLCWDKYDYIYSSRSVVKNKYYNTNDIHNFYGDDVWSDATKYLEQFLTKGMTFYYEIVGFTKSGKFIQKGYDYGCVPPTDSNYAINKHFRVKIYRITLTDDDGKVFEFSPSRVQQYCKKFGIEPVDELYYGPAKYLYPDIEIGDEWYNNFIRRLSKDKNFYMECNSPDCKNKVPHEGVVIKKDIMEPHAYKLKCFKFLDKEQSLLDKGEIDMEESN